MNSDHLYKANQIKQLIGQTFEMANSLAGDNTGNAVIYLHQACNKMNEAIQCLERGNPADEPIPADAIVESFGGIEMVKEIQKLCQKK